VADSRDGVTAAPERWDLDDRSYRVVWVAIALLLVFLHWDPLVRGLPIFGSDSSLFYPLERDFSRWLESGVFPHWSDRYLAGQPVSAEANFGLFHPLRLLLLRFAGVHAVGIWIVLHQLLAALGMAAYCREIGRSKLACALAALAFPLCGFFVSHTVHPNLLAAASWLPLLFCGVEKILRDGGLHWVALLAVASGLQYLSSSPQIGLMSTYGAALYALSRIVIFPATPGAPRRARPLLLTAGGLALGLGIAAIQILPMLEVLEQTGRLSEPEYRFSSQGSLPGYALLLLIFPAIFGTEGSSGAERFWMSDAGGVWGAWEFHCFTGALIVLLALHGALRFRASAMARTHLLLICFGVLFAFGRFTPVHGWLWYLPGLSVGRVPSRALLLVEFAMIAVAAAGLDALARRGRAAGRAWTRAAMGVLAAVTAVWVGLAVDLRLPESMLGAVFDKQLGDPASAALALEKAREATHIASTAVIVNLCLLAVAAAVGRVWLCHSRRRIFSLALIGTVALELLWFRATFGARPVEGRDVHEPPAYMAKLDASQRFLALINWSEARRDTWAEFRDALPTQLSAAWGIDTPDGNSGMSPHDYVTTLFSQLRERSFSGPERLAWAQQLDLRLRILGVGAVSARPQWGELQWPLLYQSEAVNIWKVPGPLPRAFFSSRRDLENPALREAFAATDPDPGDREQLEALIDSVAGSVTRLAPSIPEDAHFEVDASTTGTFVRTTRNVAGWSASVDGENVPIRTVVGFFQGVELSPGRHRLRFTFRVPGLHAGAALTFISLGGGLAMVFFGLLRRNGPGANAHSRQGSL
jgi:hypothetical protein